MARMVRFASSILARAAYLYRGAGMVSTSLKPASRNGLDWGSIPHGSTRSTDRKKREKGGLKCAQN